MWIGQSKDEKIVKCVCQTKVKQIIREQTVEWVLVKTEAKENKKASSGIKVREKKVTHVAINQLILKIGKLNHPIKTVIFLFV